MSRAHGFTLIELTVVIIIIAVMSVGIVPAYQRFLQHVGFESMAGDVESLFAEARNRAVTDGAEVDVVFDSSGKTFAMVEQPPLQNADQPLALQSNMPPSQSPMTAKILHLGQNFAVPMFTPGSGTSGSSSGGSSNRVRFRDDGTCDGAQLALLSSDGYSAQYLLLPATGRMQRIDAAGLQAGL